MTIKTNRTRTAEGRDAEGRAAESEAFDPYVNNPFDNEEESHLPKLPEGFKWVRDTLGGQADASNMRAHVASRLAYRPATLADLPHLAELVEKSPNYAQSEGVIRVGDLIAMKTDPRLLAQYRAANEMRAHRLRGSTSELARQLAEKSHGKSKIQFEDKIREESDIEF